ncbi:alanyl-tRNA editing protein [Aneurinibacillus thermoaerophilus]|uniref:Ala-tRNA(Pro) hydrolase n=1 Tax=Aneurinibacillus thermoaerophilus TaxID=143495 RepID=A0A1G7Y1I7_ANETH|nr:MULTISPECIES: alanyl-tRNA editing protein [Aneurinibacillus]AMA72966.1 alanyl-tRNA editing protein [Aneurinibacillus sp. XH2]MED0675908.1 alanyl-tRNA editing protein [Aneurinibacillus thermoaerophilus]MED0677817.1 alanyl-tRNA editing protein [Aneurinibacillus thermoaerophilus]MED0758137.1 alanyl-tRNA editing protein [Aneurinibacillus thermoaerophilus]MED0761291.1 alanyl-tRNA editing protein [Aneurinibacillus thermoaerophilus]
MTKELFLTDSYRRECEASVLEIAEDKVILDQTVFYPTGGGQEHDTGMLVQGEQMFEVYRVKREGGRIVHYVRNAEKLEKGPVFARVDWERRYGLMRHHTLLHVLSAVVYKKYGALCTGNQIYPDRARIDFNQLHDLTPEQLNDVMEETNRIIDSDYPISYRTVSREEAENIPGMIKTMVSLLPPSVTHVRLVSIDSVDEQACGGTHVKRTREIGQMEITNVKSKGKNNKRLEVRIIHAPQEVRS